MKTIKREYRIVGINETGRYYSISASRCAVELRMMSDEGYELTMVVEPDVAAGLTIGSHVEITVQF